MAGVYQWLSITTAISQLAARLADPSELFWTTAEKIIYLQRALAMYNCLTNTWRIDFTYNSPNLWNSLGSLTGSPRLRTATDTSSYTALEYYLLEPASGGTWTGTSQFTINDLAQALQHRRDEMLIVSACNDVLVQNIALTPGTRRTLLPDNTLDVPRVRYLALQASPTGTGSSGASSITVNSAANLASGQLVQATGIAAWTTVSSVKGLTVNLSLPTTGIVSGQVNFYTSTTLYRDDKAALQFYDSEFNQTIGTPGTFMLSSEPPLSFDVDYGPNQPGLYEAVTLQSGAALVPPGPTVLGIPNDYVWVLEWGALADLLGRESEATDRERAAYCLKRYQDGLALLTKTPWIMLGSIDGEPCSVDALEATDRYSPEWDSNPQGFGPVIVTAGIDFLAAPINSGVGVTVLGNAPFLDSTNTYVQVSRSSWDTILDLSQSFASFKMGGAEWKAALELEQRAIMACAAENVRLKSTGAFSDILLQRGQVQDRNQERYSTKSG